MPTRLVLREPTPSRLNHEPAAAAKPDESEMVMRQRADVFTTPPRNNLQRSASSRNSSSQRKVVGFRSSILRDFSYTDGHGRRGGDNEYDDDDDDLLGSTSNEAAQRRRMQLHLSNEDIRASPRLLGYLFAAIASTVMLVSVVQFYVGEDDTYKEASAGSTYNETKYPEDEFFQTINGPVYYYKLWCCIAVASAGVIMFLSILLMHFDTICFPKLWFQVFRDGSLAERNILISMAVFWSVSLHVNTSSLSVGATQANVYFTTWIVFVCTVLNLGVWRQCADLPQLAEKILIHRRETTYNWCWTLIFVLITAGAATDMYFHREDLTFQLEGEELTLDPTDWTSILAMVWAEVALCIIALVFNHYWTRACKLNCPGGCRFVLNWRFLEGILIIADMGFKFWVILVYTGADGVITGLNNAYFGIWGSFFNIVFTFGTWIRENKDDIM